MNKLLCGVVLAGVLLAGCLPAVHAQSAEDDPLAALSADDSTLCNGTATNGTIVLAPNLSKTVCNITVNGTADHYTTIVFSSLNLKGADNLTIYDGKTQLLNVTGSRDSLAVVITSEVAFLLVHITAKDSGSVLKATYDTSACNIQRTVQDTTVLKSPVYLPNKGSFSCSYLLKQPEGVSGSKLALSFTSVALPNATLNVTSAPPAKNVVVTGSGLQPDVYGSGTSLQMVLTVQNLTQAQNFSGIVTPVASSADCGLVKTVNGTFTLNITLRASEVGPMGYDCRVTLEAAKGMSLWLNLTSLRLAAQKDSLELVDGGALAAGNTLATFTSSSAAGYLVLSGQKQVLVRLMLGMMSADRSLTIDAKELDTVNHLYKGGNLTMAPSSKSAVDTAYYLLETDAGSVVGFTLAGETANKTYNYNVSVYDGSQPSSPLLVTFSSGQRVPVVSSTNKVLVVVSIANATHPLSASFSHQAPGCDKVTSAAEGNFQLMTSPSVPAMCKWTVTAPPSSSGTILLDMGPLKLSKKATVSVYRGVAGAGGSQVAHLTSANVPSMAPLPSVAVPASQWAQVVWSSGNTTDPKSVAVNVRYQQLDTLCGGKVQAPQGRLRSPAFPNLYPLNALCQWTFPAPPGAKQARVLLFDFPQFQLAQDHSVVIAEQKNGSTHQVASLGGSKPLPDVVFTTSANTTLTFSAQLPTAAVISNQVAQGFDIQYWNLKCGGFMNKSSDSFSSPGYPKQIPVTAANATLCVWMVQLPVKTGSKLNIVNLTLQIQKTGSPPVNDIVKLYDGDTLRSSPIALDLSKGNKFNNLTRFNSVLVVFNSTTKSMANADAKVALMVNYTTYICKKLCGNGICMHPDWECNNEDNCGDNTDELNCIGPPASTQKAGTKTAIVVLLFFVGLILGILLAVIIPRIIRRFRTNRYSTFRDDPPVA